MYTVLVIPQIKPPIWKSNSIFLLLDYKSIRSDTKIISIHTHLPEVMRGVENESKSQKRIAARVVFH